MKPVAVVKLREFYNRNLIFGSAVLYNSNVEVPLPLTQHGLAVRTDLSTMPLEDYIYLLLLADTLGLDYVHMHKVYAYVPDRGARRTLASALIMGVIARLLDLCLSLYNELVNLVSQISPKHIQKVIDEGIAQVLRDILINKHLMSDVNQVIRRYIDVPENLIAVTPTCAVCGRRVEFFMLPGDLEPQEVELALTHGIPLEKVKYAGFILDVLAKAAIPPLCRTCRYRWREKVYRLCNELGRKDPDVEVRRLALEELRREVKSSS
jgi:hypothetical protein